MKEQPPQKYEAGKTEQPESYKEIEEIVDELFSQGNVEKIEEIKTMEDKTPEKAQAMAAFVQMVIDRLEEKHGIERDTDGVVTSINEEKLRVFTNKYPSELIQEIIEKKLVNK